MSSAGLLWAASGISALLLLPVGAIRLVAYRSGGVDHTPTLHAVALLAVALGSAALLLFAALSVWFLLSGEQPT